MKTGHKKKPSIIITALDRIPATVNKRLKYERTINKDGLARTRGMREDYAEKVSAVLCAMVNASALALKGAIVAVKEHVARPLTVAEIANRTGLGERCVKRIIADLKAMGLIANEKEQFLRPQNGSLNCSATLRIFTMKFWRMLGLLKEFFENIKYAAKCALKLIFPVYKIRKQRPKKSPVNYDRACLGCANYDLPMCAEGSCSSEQRNRCKLLKTLGFPSYAALGH